MVFCYNSPRILKVLYFKPLVFLKSRQNIYEYKLSFQQSRTTNPREGRESDFQNHCIIIIKYPAFSNNKIITKQTNK